MSCVVLGNGIRDMKLVFRYRQNELYRFGRDRLVIGYATVYAISAYHN